MEVQIIVSNKDGEVLDMVSADVSGQHLAIIEVKPGQVCPTAVVELNIGAFQE